MAKDKGVTATPPARIGSTVGTSGLIASGGWVNEEWHKLLRGRRKNKFLREMHDNSAVIGGILNVMMAFVSGVEWRVETQGDSPKRQRGADFLEGAMGDMSHTFRSVVVRAMSMMLYGWVLFEIIWKRRLGPSPGFNSDGVELPKSLFNDRLWGIRKLGIRSQDSLDRWEFDDAGGVRGMHQNARLPNGGQKKVFIPIEKAVLFVLDPHKDSPEGRPPLRSGVRSYRHQMRLEEVEGIGMERHMAGMPTMFVPPEQLAEDADAEDKAAVAAWQKTMGEFKQDQHTGAVLPNKTDVEGKATGYDFRLMASEGQPVNMGEAIQRKKQELAQVVVAEWLMVGMQTQGSWSLHSDKTKMFAVLLGFVLETIKDTWNRFVVQRMYQLNGFHPDEWAQLVPGDMEKQEISQWASFTSMLVAAGVLTPDDALETQARKLGHIKPRADGTMDDTERSANPAVQEELAQLEATAAQASPITAPDPQQMETMFLVLERMRDRKLTPAAAVAMLRLQGLDEQQAVLMVQAQASGERSMLA